MRSARALMWAALFALLASGLATPPESAAQDSSGRPSVSEPTPRTPRTRRPRTRPKKVIRGRATTDVERVPTASVIIRSYPPGAEVFLDGQLVGTTADDGELELSDIRLGPHKVVLRKDGYREWSQTVTLTSPGDVEIEPLLQTESVQFLRASGKLPVIETGSEVTGTIGRDGFPKRDGSGFYNEYVVRVPEPTALLIVMSSRGVDPTLKIVDEGDQPYGIDKIGDGVYQSALLPRSGSYYLQVGGPVDESSFVAGDYTIRVLEERVARGETPIAIGETKDGMLEGTDLTSAPNEFYDLWSISADGGARVRIAVSSAAFKPGLTLMRDGRVVASTGKKGKKGEDASELSVRLDGGRYVLYVRSMDGGKSGAYQLSVSPQ